jgi:hypothetical protein
MDSHSIIKIPEKFFYEDSKKADLLFDFPFLFDTAAAMAGHQNLFPSAVILLLAAAARHVMPSSWLNYNQSINQQQL